MSKKKSREGSGRPDAAPAEERRRNLELRERLDELVELARRLSQHARDMTDEELDQAEIRAEWLGEEVWRSAVHGPLSGTAPPKKGRTSGDEGDG